ncbi:PucR family transcriptional regulator [Nocardia inohanensis]|uniref:PucR family transcriptional regulator n=1 Tax=Nocardia inohanensis TaxID=209246 RepID=UPI000833D520|nr:helix-turn-helix domain-containing protein [Nocardia inohanensis]
MATAVLREWQARANALIADFAAGEPPYDRLPKSMLDADFLPAAQLNVELFFDYLDTGVEPAEDQSLPLVQRVLSLTRDGMPLAEALTNYRVGTSFLWSHVTAASTPAEAELKSAVALRLIEYVTLMTSRFAEACLDDARQIRYDRVERAREIAEALLTGRDPYEWAEDAALSLADAYLVAAIRLDNPQPGILTTLRRRLGEISGAFLHRDSGGWTALLPLHSETDEPAALRELTTILLGRTRDTPASLWVGVSAAPARAQVPAAFEEAKVLAETGRSLRRPDAICRRQDMVFEYAIATSGAAPTLRAALDPLADQPVLTETLEVFIAQDFNQNAAARELCVHRNTVTYRLTRIAELTGYDPQTPVGISTLMGARVARRLFERN